VSDNATTDETMMRYLLGQLPESERDDLEGRYFSDDSLHEHLLAIEEELIDRYVNGELSVKDKKDFDDRFLESPEYRQRIQLARALAALPGPSRRRWEWSLLSQLMPHSLGMRFALAGVAAAVVTVLFAVHFWRGTNQPAPPTVAVNHPKPNVTPKIRRAPEGTTPEEVIKEPRKPLPILAFALVPGGTSRAGRGVLVEGGNEETNVTIPPGQYRIRLELGLGDADAADYQHYAVTVRTMDGNEVWRESGQLRASIPANKPSTILVTMPPGVLRPGEYVVKLSGVAPPANLAYSFRVQKR